MLIYCSEEGGVSTLNLQSVLFARGIASVAVPYRGLGLKRKNLGWEYARRSGLHVMQILMHEQITQSSQIIRCIFRCAPLIFGLQNKPGNDPSLVLGDHIPQYVANN